MRPDQQEPKAEGRRQPAVRGRQSVNARLRKIIKTRGHFPSDDAATKLIWLALRNITQDWGRPGHNWKSAMNQFAILYEDRFTKPST
ncbi:transposase-like protein [Paucibacter oligotrophus]|uniref:Transposase-like protein n=1 Tax=Roseateles oligotrophus TaxID=1769250 RepID=A0A840LCB7_9BURK|nr:transposase-like protein [Roseateles oligotrophus]